MKTASGVILMIVLSGCSDSSATPDVGISSVDKGEGDHERGPGGKDAGPPAPRLDAEIIEMLAHVRSDDIMESIAKLSSFTTRHTFSDDTAGSDAIGGARDWIQAQFAAIPGLTVELDPFTFRKSLFTKITRENVVAWKLGTGHPERLIVLGGHYDSLCLDEDDCTSPAPGANDSGSQTALLLEAARAMAPFTFDATVVFVAFAGEEQGLKGSAAFAGDYARHFAPGAKLEAMYNSDIVGGDNSVNDATTLQQFRLYSPGTPREWLVEEGSTDDTSPSRGLMRQVAFAGGLYVPSMTILPKLSEDRLDRRGDQESFVDRSCPAVRFIETVESPHAGTLLGHQHSPNDLPQYVTPDYTARMAQVVIASAASLARAPGPPASISVSGAAGGPLTVAWAAPASGSSVDHYVIAGRATTENLYHTRVSVPASSTAADVTAEQLGIAGAKSFFISVAAVDAHGHESLFAYPEYRCDTQGCCVQAGSEDVTTKD